jgi:hypothetical protein
LLSGKHRSQRNRRVITHALPARAIVIATAAVVAAALGLQPVLKVFVVEIGHLQRPQLIW